MDEEHEVVTNVHEHFKAFRGYCIDKCRLAGDDATEASKLAEKAKATAKFSNRALNRIKEAAEDAYAIAHRFKRILTSLPNSSGGEFGKFYCLPKLNDARIDTMPYSLMILLESVIRNCDDVQFTVEDVDKILDWQNSSQNAVEIPFKPGRILFQDFPGVPALVDLAAMMDAMEDANNDANNIYPQVPVTVVADRSSSILLARSTNQVLPNVHVEYAKDKSIKPSSMLKSNTDAALNLLLDRSKYTTPLFEWASSAIHNLNVLPAMSGCASQVNMEHLSQVVAKKNGILFPDSVLGMDYHITRINGLGVAGWAVSGLDASAIMFGQPYPMVLPHVLGVKLSGKLGDYVTATDVALSVAAVLRTINVDGYFVEFYGEGVRELSVVDRATIADMCLQCGAIMGFFPVDSCSLDYLRLTGREATVSMIEEYFTANHMFVDHAQVEEKVYSSSIDFDLAEVELCVAGPKRLVDRVLVKNLKTDWHACLDNEVGPKGFHIPKNLQDASSEYTKDGKNQSVKHGDIVLAVITSCNTDPILMVYAWLVAKKALELGLKVKPWVNARIVMGSKIMWKVFKRYDLMDVVKKLGFKVVECYCARCVDHTVDHDPAISDAILEKDIVAVTLLSSTCNYEWTANQLTGASYLASPPLIVAYALIGTVDFDLLTDTFGIGNGGVPLRLPDIWPSRDDINAFKLRDVLPGEFKISYKNASFGDPQKRFIAEGSLFNWNPVSTYVRSPQYLKNVSSEPPGSHGVQNAFCLLKLDESVTTDLISPAGRISSDSSTAKYLVEFGNRNLDSYSSHWGNAEVMARGAFADTKTSISWEIYDPDIPLTTIEYLPVFDAAMKYKEAGFDTFIIAGALYGTGIARDWAAKSLALLGVKAVIAKSFEKTHRKDLVRMGISPLCFTIGEDAGSLGLTGEDIFSFDFPPEISELRHSYNVTVKSSGITFICTLQFDSAEELNCYKHGGLFPYIIRRQLS